MSGNLINSYWELNFKFFAYLVGNLYLAPCYAIGFIIPPFKKIINEYESNGNTKAISFISLISGGLIYGCIEVLVPDFTSSIYEMILWYVGYFVFGFFALFLQYDFKQKKKNNS
jgi:hypothetical protein